MLMSTRSGRVVKKPAIFIPTETALDDDYCSDEYDTEVGSDIESDEECLSDESESDDEDDADENGNLQDFVVDDEEESESEDT
tara:strand:- start:254 stop:502 length:249 start_codon:yes stop_codon:yes gene_type:complete